MAGGAAALRAVVPLPLLLLVGGADCSAHCSGGGERFVVMPVVSTFAVARTISDHLELEDVLPSNDIRNMIATPHLPQL